MTTWEPGDQIRTVRYERTVEIVYEGEPPPLPLPSDAQTTRRRLAVALEQRRDLHEEASLPLALEIVRGVLAGQWVVADHFEDADRRFVIAQRSRAGDGRALSERERQVLAFAVRGHSNKYVALELGLTPSTVATHLRRAMSKLHVDSREALIQALPLEEG